MNRSELNRIHTKLFEAATDVHTLIGPGMPLGVYRSCFLYEMRIKSILFKKDIPFSVMYKDIKAGELMIDILIENHILVEVIPDESISPLSIASMQSKLRLTGLRMGIIITFNILNITDGYRKVLLNQP